MAKKWSFISWEWCELCQGYFLRCPVCGNNSCNGGYGEITVEGIKQSCNFCKSVYKLQDWAWHNDKEPNGIRNWLGRLTQVLKRWGTKPGTIFDRKSWE